MAAGRGDRVGSRSLGNNLIMSSKLVTAEDVRTALLYDPETGEFSWRESKRGRRPGACGNMRPDGYRRIGMGGINYMAHRLAWLYVTGEWPENHIDHIDGNPDNNRWSNLRDVPQQTNVQNVKGATRRNASSGLLGVSYHARDKLWRARIRSGGKNRVVGYFKSPEEAHSAYLEAKRSQHEGCTI